MSKDIWEYLLLKRMAITAKYLLIVTNKEAERASRQEKDSSEQKQDPQIFQHIFKIPGTPEIYLAISHYVASRPDPFSQGTDAIPQQRSQKILHAPQIIVQSHQNCDLDNPNMEYPSMLPTVVANNRNQANSPFKAIEHFQGSFRQQTLISNK